MKIQGVELKFGFRGADAYDTYAKEHKHSDLLGIVYDLQEERKRIEKKYSKKFDKLTKEQQAEHRMNFPASQVISLFSAFGNIPDREKVCDLLDKELDSGKSLPEITASVIMDLMQSPLYSALSAKSENPKSPK